MAPLNNSKGNQKTQRNPSSPKKTKKNWENLSSAGPPLDFSEMIDLFVVLVCLISFFRFCFFLLSLLFSKGTL